MREAVSGRCRAVILLGEDAPCLQQALIDTVPLVPVMTLAEAVTEAAGLAQPGDAVLLSPACASFDMFKSYVDRGEQFVSAVKGLAA